MHIHILSDKHQLLGFFLDQIRKLCDEALSPPGALKRWKLDF